MEALFEVAHLVADFTRVDGAVLLTDSLEVLGFGAEIAGELPEVSRVMWVHDLDGVSRTWVHTDRVGTRHRSAYRLCQAIHDALGLVVCQDGWLRFIRWHERCVAYWDQIATGPWEGDRRLERREGSTGSRPPPIEFTGEHMDGQEAQARAVIAAALIVRGAVEVPSIPEVGDRLPDGAGMRLRELTDYVYRLVTTTLPSSED